MPLFNHFCQSLSEVGAARAYTDKNHVIEGAVLPRLLSRESLNLDRVENPFLFRFRVVHWRLELWFSLAVARRAQCQLDESTQVDCD